jgi:diguanylate cyclase (GGDEF)-like protein
MRFGEFKIYKYLASLERISTSRLTVASLLLVLILGAIDYLTGFELSFSFFYLIPVTIIAWALGRRAGLWISMLCAITWLASNLLSGQIFSSPFIGVWNTLIRFGFYAVVTILLAELRHALEEERHLANTDPLTGALNRRSFSEIVEKKMIAVGVNRHPFTMVYIDLDNFKTINDTLGHATGDLVLKAVVDVIHNHIRNTDYLARLGGDEFAILLPDTNRKQTQPIVQRIHSSLTEKMKFNQWGITFSIGALTFLSMPESVDKMVSLTDTLMYEVKEMGKNAIEYAVFE